MKNLSTMPRMQRVFAVALLFILMNTLSFAQSVLFRDDFNGAMQSGWAWTRENPATWSLTPTGLQIELEYGDLWQGWTNNCRNMLLRPAPGADFIVEAKLDVSLVAPINQAHILLYYNDDYYVRFGPVLSYGYQVLIDVVHEVGGGIAHQSGASWGSNLVYLKIQKSGSTASCYYSSDGQNWTLHHTISNLNFSVDQVGLVAFDGSEPPSSSVATYDYFEIRDASQPPPVCVNPPSGLVSWWPGEDDANDIQSSNHGTLQNGATFVSGLVGQAFSFDGVDDAAFIADNAGLRVSSFTLDAWINTADATLIQPIIAKVQTSENWISYMLRIQDGGKLALIVENRAENRYAHWRTLSTLSSNRWYHVTGTWQNLNGDNSDAKIYIDGVEQAIEMSLNNEV